MVCTGARIFLESLKREGVDLFFGYPGGAVIDIYNELSIMFLVLMTLCPVLTGPNLFWAMAAW